MELEHYIQTHRFDSLRLEDEVKQFWSSEVEPLVSIVCMCFNHSDYIEGALCGLFIQETNYPFEVMIHDDASTDGSAEVIRRFEARYPSIIRATYQTENQYSQGRRPGLALRQKCRGRYICSCEGDDFWVVAAKLQRQFDYMEAHPEASLCFHQTVRWNQESNEQSLVSPPAADESEVDMLSLFQQRGNQIATASIFLRNEDWTYYAKSMEGAPVGDVFTKTYKALEGKIVYLDFVGAVYRIFAKGSFTEKNKVDGLSRHADLMIVSVDRFYHFHRDKPGAHLFGVILVDYITKFTMLKWYSFGRGRLIFRRISAVKHFSRIKLLRLILLHFSRQMYRKATHRA